MEYRRGRILPEYRRWIDRALRCGELAGECCKAISRCLEHALLEIVSLVPGASNVAFYRTAWTRSAPEIPIVGGLVSGEGEGGLDLDARGQSFGHEVVTAIGAGCGCGGDSARAAVGGVSARRGRADRDRLR